MAAGIGPALAGDIIAWARGVRRVQKRVRAPGRAGNKQRRPGRIHRLHLCGGIR